MRLARGAHGRWWLGRNSRLDKTLLPVVHPHATLSGVKSFQRFAQFVTVSKCILFAHCGAAELPKVLIKGETYQLTFTVPLSISRQRFAPLGRFSAVEETQAKPQKTWFVEIVDLDASGWILCDDPKAVTGVDAGSNSLIPPVWISVGAIAVIQPIQPRQPTGNSRQRAARTGAVD